MGEIPPKKNPTHIFTSTTFPKEFTILLTVTDQHGETSQTSSTITLTQSANQAPLGQITYKIRKKANIANVSFKSHASDPNGNSLTYSWDFGDGSRKSKKANPKHDFQLYSSIKKYKIKLTLNDNKGGITKLSTKLKIPKK